MESTLLNIKDKVIEYIENKLYSLGLFLDFRKAFDTIEHYILLNKLNDCRVRGPALQLIGNYLTHRCQHVVNKRKSGNLNIRSGLPQGSILGPLLFLIYVNDNTTIPVSSIGHVRRRH